MWEKNYYYEREIRKKQEIKEWKKLSRKPEGKESRKNKERNNQEIMTERESKGGSEMGKM